MADLISVIVGGAIGISGTLGVQYFQQRHQKRAVRAAARAYVSGVLKMEATRRHADRWRGVVADWKRGVETSVPIIFGAEEAVPDPLLQSLADKVGLLDDDVAGDMVEFANIKVGLEIDLRAIAKGSLASLSPQDRVTVMDRDLALWDQWIELGNDLVRRLAPRRPWWRRPWRGNQ